MLTWPLPVYRFSLLPVCLHVTCFVPPYFPCYDGMTPLKLCFKINPSSPRFFSFLRYWGLNLGPTPEQLHQPFFVLFFYQDRVLWTISPGWLWTAISLISASWIARTTDVSHQCLASLRFFISDILITVTTKLIQLSSQFDAAKDLSWLRITCEYSYNVGPDIILHLLTKY
jgi:hypothetical protein